MENQLIHSVAKNDSEEIRISLREFKNRQYLDLRLFFQPSDGSDMCPSKKGITVGVELLPKILEGLFKAEKTAQELKKTSGNTSQANS